MTCRGVYSTVLFLCFFVWLFVCFSFLDELLLKVLPSCLLCEPLSSEFWFIWGTVSKKCCGIRLILFKRCNLYDIWNAISACACYTSVYFWVYINPMSLTPCPFCGDLNDIRVVYVLCTCTLLFKALLHCCKISHLAEAAVRKNTNYPTLYLYS